MEQLLWAGIALCQVVALPGWLAVRALRLDEDGPLRSALLCFGLSLVLNHALVVGLVLVGAYTRPVLLGVMTLELALAVPLLRRTRRASPAAPVWTALQEDPRLLGPALAAALAVGFLASQVPVSFAHVFEYWDAIVSWNRWAVDWEAGRLPVRIYHYPQLLPTTWSLLYVLVGQPIQLLARGVMALFPLGIALVFVDLGLRRRRPDLLWTAALATLLLGVALGRHIGAGLADIPVAFFAVLALAPVLAGDLGAAPEAHARRLAACGLAAIGCALTKQAGLYAAALLPVFAAATLRGLPRRKRALGVGALALALVAGIAPWYAYAELLVTRGQELNELPLLTQKVFGDASLLERAGRALALWQALLTPPILLAAVGLVLASLWHPPTRWITLALSLPFTLLWALFFSYDVRNHALALPFLAWSIAGGATRLGSALAGRRAVRVGAVLAALGLLWIALWTEPGAIARAQERQLVEVGKPALNRRLLEYERDPGFDAKILTNYRYLTSFPSLRGAYFVNRDAPGAEFWPFRAGVEAFARAAENPAHDIGFVLLSGRVDEEIEQYVRERVRSGAYAPVFQTSGGRLFRIRRR